MHEFYNISKQGKNSFLRSIGLFILLFIIVVALTIVLSLFLIAAGIDPNIIMDEAGHPNLFLAVNLASFAALLIVLFLLFKPFHYRSVLTLITPNKKIKWTKIGFSFVLWFLLSGLGDGVNFIIDPSNYTFNPQFNWTDFAIVFAMVVILIPFQTSFEEVLFRGYLNQAFGRVFKYSWIAVILTSTLFASGHLANPEIATYGTWAMMLNYFSMGIFLCLVTVWNDSLELALGIHCANNIYASLMVTFKSSALQTPAIFSIGYIDAWTMYFLFLPMAVLYLLIISKKYRIKFSWKVLGRIDFNPKPFFTQADSAVISGHILMGKESYIAQGTVIRTDEKEMRIGVESMILENSVIISTKENPTTIGSKTVLGHRTVVIGAEIGNFCEIGNASLVMPGAKVGDWCIFGEGTYIPKNTIIPERSVVVGKPGKVIRSLTKDDVKMITRMHGGNIEFPKPDYTLVSENLIKEHTMGKLYPYQDKEPKIAESTFLFESAEITGDVIIGENCIIGAGVKIIGDSHGPVRIGNNVQILENTVLHLLPDNTLDIADHVIIGPGCVIHGCHIGEHSVIEPGVIVSDHSVLGKNTVVKAGSVVKQRSVFNDFALLEGFPAVEIGNSTTELKPNWILKV